MNVLKIVLGITAGGAAGYLWHRIVGCASGMCPLVRNPYLSVIWGALLGFIFAVNR
ncbi:MAG: DUF6132 family protein [Elusimicrobia bacterium]|nr:DUF6132 family protein [Elusimicrobiota bacterium]